jgi:hypothetical protein
MLLRHYRLHHFQLHIGSKGKGLSVDATKAQMGNRGIAKPTGVIDERLNSYRERTLVPIEQEAGKAPRLVWTFWRRGKSLAPACIRTTDRPAPNIVPISTITPATA